MIEFAARRRLTGETPILRELLLEVTGRVPTPPRVLFARVADEFGAVCERRMWRVLRFATRKDRGR